MRLSRLFPILLIAATANLAACATVPPASETAARVAAAIDRADAAYQRAKPFVVLLAATLPPERAAQTRAIMLSIEASIAHARVATSAAEQLAALAEAEAALIALAMPSAAAP